MIMDIHAHFLQTFESDFAIWLVLNTKSIKLGKGYYLITILWDDILGHKARSKNKYVFIIVLVFIKID